MDGQLQRVLSLLNEYKIPYWLNSGTLLGLWREGDLLPFDLDIDISLWEEDAPGIGLIAPFLRKEGYTRYSASYKGLPFHYCFSPRDSRSLRQLDISIFRRSREYAWCPEYYFRANPHRAAGRNRSFIVGAARSGVRFCWRKLTSRVSLNVTVTSWPWRSFINMGTWWIPRRFFENLTFITEFNAFVPSPWEEYLAFRYGDWRVAKQDWVFHRDDGGFVDAPPYKVSGELP